MPAWHGRGRGRPKPHGCPGGARARLNRTVLEPAGPVAGKPCGRSHSAGGADEAEADEDEVQGPRAKADEDAAEVRTPYHESHSGGCAAKARCTSSASIAYLRPGVLSTSCHIAISGDKKLQRSRSP